MTTLKKLTNKEFKALERNEDGRLINLPDVFYLLTAEQIDKLHEDDWSYYDDLCEEMSYLYAEAVKEFS